MTVIEYDLKATRIATKRCSPRIALLAILVMVILAALVGSVLYFHQLWPFTGTKQVENTRQNLTIALLKHKEDQFLIAPGAGGKPFGAVFNESLQDVLSLNSVVRQIASYEFRMHLKPGGKHRQPYGENIIPDDIERKVWDAPVDSRFVMKISYDGNRIVLEYLVDVESTRGHGDHPEYDGLFETLQKAASMLPDFSNAEGEVISSDLHDLQ